MIYIAQQKEIISTINNLIETLKDGEEGFKQASAAVKDSQLKSGWLLQAGGKRDAKILAW